MKIKNKKIEEKGRNKKSIKNIDVECNKINGYCYKTEQKRTKFLKRRL